MRKFLGLRPTTEDENDFSKKISNFSFGRKQKSALRKVGGILLWSRLHIKYGRFQRGRCSFHRPWLKEGWSFTRWPGCRVTPSQSCRERCCTWRGRSILRRTGIRWSCPSSCRKVLYNVASSDLVHYVERILWAVRFCVFRSSLRFNWVLQRLTCARCPCPSIFASYLAFRSTDSKQSFLFSCTSIYSSVRKPRPPSSIFSFLAHVCPSFLIPFFVAPFGASLNPIDSPISSFFRFSHLDHCMTLV